MMGRKLANSSNCLRNATLMLEKPPPMGVVTGPFSPTWVRSMDSVSSLGMYAIDDEGNPCHIGMTQGNEFSDHKFEKRNYLNLAGSKLRTCSIGPELVIGPEFAEIGRASCRGREAI